MAASVTTTDEEGFEIGSFDNEYTLLYKFAHKSQLPVSFIVKWPHEGETMRRLPDLIEQLIGEGRDVYQTFTAVREHNPSLKTEVFERAFSSLYVSRRGGSETERKEELRRKLVELYRSIGDVSKEARVKSEDAFAHYRGDNSIYDIAVEEMNYRANGIARVQREMRSAERENIFADGDFNITGATVAFDLRFRDREEKVSAIHGFEIFDRIVPSVYVPYIRYNGNDHRNFHKLFDDPLVRSSPKYDHIVGIHDKSEKSDSIYMTLWLGDKDNENPSSFYRSSRENFHTMSINVRTGVLKINIPYMIRGRDVNGLVNSKERVSKVLSFLHLDNERTLKVRSEILLIPLYGERKGLDIPLAMDSGNDEEGNPIPLQLEMQEFFLLHLILNDEVFSRNLYIEESVIPFPFKHHLDLRYRPMYSDLNEGQTVIDKAYISNRSSVSFSLNVEQAGPREKVRIFNPATNEYEDQKAPFDYNYLHINVTSAVSEEEIRKFMAVMKSLFTIYYAAISDSIEREDFNLYANLNVETNPVHRKITHFSTPSSQADRRRPQRIGRGEAIAMLRGTDEWRDIFMGRYVRQCQPKGRHPRPFSTREEAAEYASQRPFVNKRGLTEERAVTPFPSEDPKLFYVCPDDDYPYPSLIQNKDKNAKEYKFLPCCSSNPPDMQPRQRFNREYGMKVKEIKARELDILKTNEAIDEGRLAYIPSVIGNLLSSYNVGGGTLIRLGMPASSSSFLHAILHAIGDPEYRRTRPLEREEYVQKIRAYLSRNVEPSLLAQEMYAYEAERIRRDLSDPAIFLDPARHYRAVEEIFRINIFCFVADVSEGRSNIAFDMPAHKHFHVRPYRPDRYSVILYKDVTPSNVRKHPQCEPIINLEGGQQRSLYGPSMTKICRDIISMSQNVLTWSQSEPMRASLDLYSSVDYLRLLKGSAISQRLDSSGKMRAVTFRHKGNLITLIVLPAQPLNLPLDQTVHKTDIRTAKEILGRPGRLCPDSEGNLDGLWFGFSGFEEAILVKIKEGDRNSSSVAGLPVGSIDPINSEGDSVIGRMRRLRRVLSFIKQFLVWIFDLYRRRLESPLDGEFPEDFIDRYFRHDRNPGTEDSSLYYDISKVGYQLPRVRNETEALLYLESIGTNISRDGALNFYSLQFRKNMEVFIRDYHRRNVNVNIRINDSLEGYFDKYDSFTQHKDCEVFIGKGEMREWLRRKVTSLDTLNVHDHLREEDANVSVPFLFRNEDSKIYMVQNPLDGRRESALHIAHVWNADRVNPGPHVEAGTIQDFSHIVYRISIDGHLIPVIDNSDGNEIYLRILNYQTVKDELEGIEARYGALLELL